MDLDGNPRDREFEAIDGIARKLNICDNLRIDRHPFIVAPDKKG